MKRKQLFARGPSRNPARFLKLRCEGLEERRLMAADALALDSPVDGPEAALVASAVVNSTVDRGDANPGGGQCQVERGSTECTLRAAIEEINTGEAFIFFDVPGECSQPASALPVITQPVVIDGYTQPNARLCIEINGRLITDRSSGLVFESAGKELEQKLNGVGDDGQLANAELQNLLQKHQQTLRMMSNISKMLFDTATSVIRGIGD